MVRQFRRRATLAPILVAIALALVGCGIKGPLRPAPKAAPAIASPAPSNPATTSGAASTLPPQSPAPERKP